MVASYAAREGAVGCVVLEVKGGWWWGASWQEVKSSWEGRIRQGKKKKKIEVAFNLATLRFLQWAGFKDQRPQVAHGWLFMHNRQ